MDLDAKINCSGCGYDLMGLPPEGKCPECGQSYDVPLGMGVTKRSALMEKHHRGDRAVYLLKLWGLISLAAACLGIGGLLALGAAQPMRPMAMGMLFAALFAFAAVATWFTERK